MPPDTQLTGSERVSVKADLTIQENMQLMALAASYGITRQQVIRRLIDAEYKRWLRGTPAPL